MTVRTDRWPWAYMGKPSSLADLLRTRDLDVEAFRRRYAESYPKIHDWVRQMAYERVWDYHMTRKGTYDA